MAGNSKNEKTPGAAKAKPGAAKAVASEAPTKAQAAKPTASPAVAKATATAPKLAEVKLAEAPKSEVKPVEKAEAKQADKAADKRAARVAFTSGWKQTVEGELVSGGQLTLSYDPSRAQLVHKSGGKPAWGVQAFVKLVPSGQVVEQPAVDFAGASAKARPVTVEIPKGTTEVQVWFKNWAAADRPGESWDSNFGRNYRFAVRP